MRRYRDPNFRLGQLFSLRFFWVSARVCWLVLRNPDAGYLSLHDSSLHCLRSLTKRLVVQRAERQVDAHCRSVFLHTVLAFQLNPAAMSLDKLLCNE